MKKWLIVILSVAWLAWELIAALDGDKATWPLTHIIVEHVPESLGLAAVGLLAGWVTVHFRDAYRKRSQGGAMVEPLPVPPTKEADARNRAVRTFWQGLGIDVTVALLVTIGPALVGSDFAFSREYLLTLGVLAAKTVVAAGVSYLMRKLVPPSFDPPRTAAPARTDDDAGPLVPPRPYLPPRLRDEPIGPPPQIE